MHNEKANLREDCISGNRSLTKVQIGFILFVMVSIVFISTSAMLTYSNATRPSEKLFDNSQTFQILD